jgi:hypothetical protein
MHSDPVLVTFHSFVVQVEASDDGTAIKIVSKEVNDAPVAEQLFNP